MYFDRITKKPRILNNVFIISDKSDAAVLIKTNLEEHNIVQIPANMIYDEDVHFLFFIGKSICVELAEGDCAEAIFRNPMIKYIKTDKNIEFFSFQTTTQTQRDIKNLVCNIKLTYPITSW